MVDPIATAADYADAMLVARRFKNCLFIVLLIVLLSQLGLFVVARTEYGKQYLPKGGSVASATAAANITRDAAGNVTADFAQNPTAFEKLRYVNGIGLYFGLTFSIALSFILLLIVTIMLVGRLIGVSRVTSAFAWSVVLAVMLFPWQSFFRDTTQQTPDFVVPGVLYTWNEYTQHARFGMDGQAMTPTQMALKWARFAGFPAAALVLLLAIQLKSGRGLKEALGEDSAVVEPKVL